MAAGRGAALPGAPQGGVVSPILANPYLHKVDAESRGRADQAATGPVPV